MKNRAGFTMVELVVVTVLGALLIGATLQILVTNQRTYTAQNAQIQGTQAIRAALDVLSSELREISPAGGDILAMNNDSLRVRGARKLGLICHDSARGTDDWRVLKVGDWFEANDSVFIFADNNGDTDSDDVWFSVAVTSVDTTSNCGTGNQAQLIDFSSILPFTTDSVSMGAEVRSFIHIAYGLMTYSGETFLGRKVQGGSWTPVVGPVSNRGISFVYRDSNGNMTGTGTSVAQIEITVRTDSDVLDSTGNNVADSVTVRVFTRN